MSTYRALSFSYLNQYASMFLQLISTMVVSRLLLPEEVGIYSIGAALLIVANSLRQFGTGQYIIQEKDLNRVQIRAALTTTLIVGWSLAAVMGVIAPYAGQYYDEPGVTEVVIILSLNMLMLPFGTVTAAYLRRQMNFKPIAIAGIASATITSLVTIYCAFIGLSYASMAWGSLSGTITTLIILSIYRPKEMPLLPGTEGVAHVFSFGAKISAIAILKSLSNTLPALVLGKSLGLHATGIFSRSNNAIKLFEQLVNKGLGPVSTPLFAKKHRNSQDLYEPYFKVMSYITILAWPFFGVMAILAEDLIRTLFGSNWLEVIPLVQIGCVGAALLQLTPFAGRVMLATQNIDFYTRISYRMIVIRVVLVVPAAFISLYAVCITVASISLIRFLVVYKPIQQVTGISHTQYIQVSLYALAVALPTMAGAYFGKTGSIALFGDIVFLSLISGVISASIVWVISVFLIKHPLTVEIKKIIKLVKLS